MIIQPAALKKLDRERGDLFAVCLPEHSLVVQLLEQLEDADKADTVAVAGEFLFNKENPEELWVRIVPHGMKARCKYLSPTASCPECAASMRIVDEQFVCNICKDAELART